LALKWNQLKDHDQPVAFPESGYKWSELGQIAQMFYRQHVPPPVAGSGSGRARSGFYSLLSIRLQVLLRIANLNLTTNKGNLATRGTFIFWNFDLST